MDARIGGVRKTSNGCGVAKRVPRKDAGFRLPSGNIAAIDFGTTHCSLAYVTVGDGFEDGPRRLPLNTTFYRVPTAILFTPDGMIHSFGYDARYEYLNLDDSERLEHIYFEQIKMDLQHDETVNREKKILGKNGKEYYLVDTIAQVLKYLKNELIENHLKRGGYPLEATDFDWVITVPAIWRARGKQMMREAGYKAGLCSGDSCGKLKQSTGRLPLIPDEEATDKLSLALEPESAAIYCQSMSRNQLATYAPADLPVTSSYLVVDIGGGTVDISAHRISASPEEHAQSLQPPAGNDCGGSKVNQHFMKFLGSLVGDEEFTRYTCTPDEKQNAESRAHLNELVNETFEKQKKIFGSKTEKKGKMSIRLPFSFMQVYQTDLEKGVKQLNDQHVELSNYNLRLAYKKMEEFFNPVVDGLLSCIAETLDDVEERVDTIYLVGGFGGCHYVCSAVMEKFGDKYKYVIPAEPDFAVVRGAVMFRQNPQRVQSRRADATYGVRANIPFIEGIHDIEYKCIMKDGKEYCENIFSTFIERGDVLSTREVFVRSYAPTSAQEKRMHIDIYSSSEKDVWYTTGRPTGSSNTDIVDIRKIGELTIPLLPPITEDPQGTDEQNTVKREVEVTFDFSHTEIQVKGYDTVSKTEVKLVLDFLSC